MAILKPFEQSKTLTRYGAVVDCIFFDLKSSFIGLETVLKEHTLPSGAPKFKIKREPVYKVPINLASTPGFRHHELSFDPLEWLTVTDPSVEELVALLEKWEGALVTGPAGTGKTWTLRKAIKLLKSRLKEKGVEVKNLNCAVRHAAARLIDGKTIAHLLNKYRMQGGPKNAKNCIFLIDEASEIPLCMWTELAQWYLLGVRFVIIGDFDGQFLPMFDRWGPALRQKDIQTSLFFHSLCEGTRVNFTQYRRGDASAKPLFDFYTGLYPRLKFEDQDAVVKVSLEEAQQFFGRCETMPDTMLCLSHKKRMLLNHAANLQISRQLEMEGVETRLVPKTSSRMEGVTMAPQDFKIWKGMELLGCIRQSNSKTVINGVWYVVVGWDERYVHLNVHERYRKQPGDDTDDENEADEEEDVEEDPAEGEIPAELKLTFDNVSKWLRPMHALCYGSIQGCTMADKRILLLDTQRPQFTLRHLIVGVSRATHQDKVHVADAGYERDLMRCARMYCEEPLQGGRDTFKYEDAEFERDDSQDLALYFNDPADVHTVPAVGLQHSEAPPVDIDAEIDAFFSGAVEDEVDSDGDAMM